MYSQTLHVLLAENILTHVTTEVKTTKAVKPSASTRRVSAAIPFRRLLQQPVSSPATTLPLPRLTAVPTMQAAATGRQLPLFAGRLHLLLMEILAYYPFRLGRYVLSTLPKGKLPFRGMLGKRRKAFSTGDCELPYTPRPAARQRQLISDPGQYARRILAQPVGSLLDIRRAIDWCTCYPNEGKQCTQAQYKWPASLQIRNNMPYWT